MNETDFKIGDLVLVSATATGAGEDIPGRITGIEYFAGHTLIDISYLRLSAIGTYGICVCNLALISKL